MPTFPAALLCDMDGTLVDTEQHWLDSVAELLAAHGESPGDETLLHYAGLPFDTAVPQLAAHLPFSVEETARRLDAAFMLRIAAGVTAQPGAVGLLELATAHGTPVALVTASGRPVVDLVLRTLGAERFACTVTADDTARSKPHPDPYLAATDLLGVEPSDCLAVEDTPTGVASALAAGCRVLGVPTVPGLQAGPRTWIRDSLDGVRWEELHTAWA
ncbi:HAD family hydrolase [Streptomyces sulphureus]|uniref:HAD family hydrolase n=1 Tax=Streptomyces sulphureus TaxID=47758 RepID=UPI0003822CB7|nr:HAD family phosphatase [Streptomyces sulphureus]